jgi:hypothetical protein
MSLPLEPSPFSDSSGHGGMGQSKARGPPDRESGAAWHAQSALLASGGGAACKAPALPACCIGLALAWPHPPPPPAALTMTPNADAHAPARWRLGARRPRVCAVALRAAAAALGELPGSQRQRARPQRRTRPTDARAASFVVAPPGGREAEAGRPPPLRCPADAACRPALRRRPLPAGVGACPACTAGSSTGGC